MLATEWNWEDALRVREEEGEQRSLQEGEQWKASAAFME
jgi:hypothetical protein